MTDYREIAEQTEFLENDDSDVHFVTTFIFIYICHSNVFIFVPLKDKLGKGFPLNLAHTTLTGPVIKINQVRSPISC